MTVEEQAWLDDICRLGCCVCVRLGWGPTPAEPHHLLSGTKRIEHLSTIPLCPTHHRSELNNPHVVSRHHHKREFERRYGTELELLEWSKGQVEILRRMTV